MEGDYTATTKSKFSPTPDHADSPKRRGVIIFRHKHYWICNLQCEIYIKTRINKSLPKAKAINKFQEKIPMVSL